jgi:hypothetical protein
MGITVRNPQLYYIVKIDVPGLILKWCPEKRNHWQVRQWCKHVGFHEGSRPVKKNQWSRWICVIHFLISKFGQKIPRWQILWFEITLFFGGHKFKAQHSHVFFGATPQKTPTTENPTFSSHHRGETEAMRFFLKLNGLGVCFSGEKNLFGHESKLIRIGHTKIGWSNPTTAKSLSLKCWLIHNSRRCLPIDDLASTWPCRGFSGMDEAIKTRCQNQLFGVDINHVPKLMWFMIFPTFCEMIQ